MNQPPAPIAIIGVGCRLPGGASSLDKLWGLLSEGRSGRVEVPKDRWNAEEWFDAYPEAKQSLITKHGFFLQEDISQFDTKFFGISSAEAHSMDPQQRLFLMTTYEALEDAAIPIETLRGSNTGVYASIFERSYDRMGHKDLSTISNTHLNGTGESILSNRISYCFDLKGPCMTIDTGCSGSLVALHQACHSIRSGESDLALVGSSQLVIHPDLLAIMSGMGMLNPDGKSYAFDSRGDGYGRGEGVATIVLKRLDCALRDGDRVHAVIVNSGINQDGKTSGLNTPSSSAQASLSSRVYREAGLNPADTTFVEAHGTGTKVGDREEVASISEVFCENTARKDDLYIGSVKTNVGHLEAASGMAGLLKSILVLKHGYIPPNLDFIKPKASLKLYEKKIKIPTELTKLPAPRDGGPPRVSLNSFGYGGTNCHVILQADPSSVLLSKASGIESQEVHGIDSDASTINGNYELSVTTARDESSSSPPELVILSASTDKSLKILGENLAEWTKAHQFEPQALRNLSFTLGIHRSALPYRRSIVACNMEEVLKELKEPYAPKRPASTTSISFVFSGQGAQWPEMGRELFMSSSCFRDSMTDMDDVLRMHGCPWSIIEELNRPAENSRINEAELAQPTTTAIQIALVDTLRSFSIRPSRVIGHSSGEIAAAYTAGALDRDNAVLIAYNRGVYASKAKTLVNTPGAMLAAGLGEIEATKHVNNTTSGTAVVACVNSPSSTTISGDETAIDEIMASLDMKGVFSRKLVVDTAYHSHHMQQVAKEYGQSISNIKSYGTCDDVTFYSTVTGGIKTSNFDADYWTSNLVSQVKFSQGLAALRNDQYKAESSMSCSIFIEIGPHSALAGPSRQTLSDNGPEKSQFEYLSALSRNADATRTALGLLGRLFELGLGIDLTAILSMINGPRPEIIRDLKPYPWDLVSYWRESRLSRAHRFRQFPNHDLLGLFDPASSIQEPRWRYFINLDALPWLRDHVVESFTIYPGAAYLTMAIEGIQQLEQLRQVDETIAKFVIRDVKFLKSIVLNDPEDSRSHDVEVQLSMSAANQYDSSRWQHFQIRSCETDGSWSEHCSGQIMVEYESDGFNEVEGTRERDLYQQDGMRFFETAQQSCDTDLTGSDFYKFSKMTGNDFSGGFACVKSAKYGNRRGIFEVHSPDIASLMPHRSFRPHVIHPTTLDACQQLNGVLFKKFITNTAFVPTMMPLVEISANISTIPGTVLTGAMEIDDDGPKASRGEGWVFQTHADGQLRPVIRLSINLRAVGEVIQEDDRPFIQDKVNRLDWNLDVDFMTGACFLNVLASTLGLDEQTTYGYDGTKMSIENAQRGYLAADQASSIWMRNAVDYIEGKKIDVPPQLAKFFAWMKKWLTSDYCLQITSDLDTDKKIRILEGIESSLNSAELQLLSRVGKALPSIMDGTIEPLAVMLEGNLLSKNYESGTFTGDYESAVAYLKLLTFKNPRLRVLEIGAGTGGCTKWLLRGLSGQNGSHLPVEMYTFTDISAGFFEEARETFAEWEDFMEFRTLDIDMDPTEQGFEPGSFDVVVAANVLHATTRINVTMERVRNLLQPGGTLVLLEIAPRGAAVGLVAGTLTGWWAHEDEFRVDTPLLHREQWAEVLLTNGFGGIHVARNCMMIAKAVPPPNNETLAQKSMVLLTDVVEESTDHISRGLSSHDIDTKICLWNRLEVEEDKVYVVIDRAERPLLLDPQPYLFEAMNTLFNTKARVLWVILQDNPDANSTAYKGVATVLVRVLRRETGNTGLVTLDIRDHALDAKETAQVVAQVARRRFWSTTSDERSIEPEFAFQNGRMLIPRVRPDDEFLKWARAQSGKWTKEDVDMEVLPYQRDRALKLDVATPGLLSSLRFIDCDLSPAVQPFEIEVKSDAHGLNYEDVCVALGLGHSGLSMAGEFAGVVTAVGEQMRDIYEVGDRVMGLGAQPFSNLPRVHGHHAHKIPDSMSAVVAASLPYTYTAAYYCIMHIARLQSGQSILIHGASGAVGQAAIQIAQHVSATIYCTVSTAEDGHLVADHYGISKRHIFSNKTTSLKQGIMRLTNGQGVDLALNCSTDETPRGSLECIRALGTFIELKKSNAHRVSNINVGAFEKSVTLTSLDLPLLAARQPRQLHCILGDILELMHAGALRPIQPITIYGVDQIEDAFRFLSLKRHTGKVALTIKPDSMVKCLPETPPSLQLRKDGTYVVAGGLGDLPSRICVLLAARGAGHIVSLSRRAVDDGTREKYMVAVKEHGGRLHILTCDITDSDDMEHARSYCSTLPPVRGVINGAMVLRDRTFRQMTIDEWKLPLQPKVFGTINLDRAFASSELDFFVTLSSIVSVVGKSGQSNYAAANGFEDAFAYAHADHPHTHYVSVNIGVVSVDAHGALKESQETDTSGSSMRAGLRQNSVMDITFDEFFANIEYVMTGLARDSKLHQTIQGVTYQSMFDANDEHLLENPVFCQLTNAHVKGPADAVRADKIDFTKALGSVKTIEEAEKLICDATLMKFSLFLDRPIDEIRVDQSLSTIGLDSLVSIELKNWMVRTFQVNLQTSELGGNGSIKALTATVASRSKLIHDHIRQPLTDVIHDVGDGVLIPVNGHMEAGHGFYCCRTSNELPRHPLVNLDEAVKDLLDSIGHFSHTREEYLELSRKAHALAAPGSLGRKLYDELRTQADDPKVESWIAGPLLKALHVKRRYPIAPFSNFLATHFDSTIQHSQAERAAALTKAVCEFKFDLDAGKLEPDFLGERANCSHSLSWLFNSVREPNLGCDKMVTYPGHDHIAVLRRGHLFKVPLLQGDRIIAYQHLRAIFQGIVDLKLDEMRWTGMLTTDNRDNWASNRSVLLSVDCRNSVYLDTIERSVFVMCLDEDSPITREDRVYSGYLGDSFNRWHDKSLQLIVTANGRSGSIFEHSMIDFMTISQLSRRIQDAIYALTPNRNATYSNGTDFASLEEIPLYTTESMEQKIDTLRSKYAAITREKQYTPHSVTSFGKSFLLSHLAPIKATVDLTIQLASRLYFGYLPASWETVSTAHFHLGRPEIVQVVLKSVVEFCDAALDDVVPRTEARNKLLQAARECNAQIVKGTEGRNYFRLMDVLEVMSEEQAEEKVPELFSDPVWKRGYPRLIMQTMIETKLAEDPGYTMEDPESVWMNYTVNEDSVEVCFVGPRKGAEKFQAALNRAAEIIKVIIQAKE